MCAAWLGTIIVSIRRKMIWHIQCLSVELTTSPQHNDQIEQSLTVSMVLLRLLKFSPTSIWKIWLKYIQLWQKLPMMSIGQALVQIAIGVNPCLSISNPLFPLFCHHSLAHCLAHRLSIAMYGLRSLHHFITVLLIVCHMLHLCDPQNRSHTSLS
jgi:hypothetical protein